VYELLSSYTLLSLGKKGLIFLSHLFVAKKKIPTTGQGLEIGYKYTNVEA
jgi:hypothetical protein